MGRHNGFPAVVGSTRPHGAPCVFISHRPQEKPLARGLAAYLDVLALHYYMDEHDAVLNQALARGLSVDAAVEECVDSGMRCCTHLLGILTGQSVRSWRVPYEIGEASGRGCPVAFVATPGVRRVPDYARCAQILRTPDEISAWCESLAEWPARALSVHFADDYQEIKQQMADCSQDDEAEGWLEEMRLRLMERAPLLHGARDEALSNLTPHLAPTPMVEVLAG